MRNKVILITGAIDGIGRQTAVELAALVQRFSSTGAIWPGQSCSRRDPDVTGNREVDFFIADFASLKQVRELAAEVQRQYDRLNVPVNNEGVFMNEGKSTGNGFEMTYAVNHLAPFLLTNLLLDLLKRSAPYRVITVSSVAHTRANRF